MPPPPCPPAANPQPYTKTNRTARRGQPTTPMRSPYNWVTCAEVQHRALQETVGSDGAEQVQQANQHHHGLARHLPKIRINQKRTGNARRVGSLELRAYNQPAFYNIARRPNLPQLKLACGMCAKLTKKMMSSFVVRQTTNISYVVQVGNKAIATATSDKGPSHKIQELSNT